MSNNIRQAVIFAAGKGTRFSPYSAMSPKALFKVNGEPLIKRSLEQIDQSLPDLDRIVILSGDDNGLIQKSLLTHSAVNKCDFISVPENYISMGLIGGYAFIKNQIGKEELFLSVLGDEYYGGKDHPRFVDFINKTKIISGCCAIKRFTYPDEYLKNYSVEIDSSNKITQITEKPTTVTSEYFGLGFFAARGHLCSLASDSVETLEKVELFDLLQKTSSPMAPLVGFEFKDTYVNVNTRSDIYDCLRQTRTEKQHSIDIIIPTWNEAKTIKYVVEDFLQYADSVIVMDNISEDGTARIARDAGAKVYSEPLKGYGDAIKKGLDRSSADILVIVESDGTFRANDLPKILGYLDNSDAVIGSRTYWQYVEYGANMDFFQRIMNMLFGTIITILWWNRKSRFTDVGCSYRAIWRSVYLSIQEDLKCTGPDFAPEFVIALLENWYRVIEIPVPYHARVLGQSKFSSSYFHLAKTAMKMFSTILSRRIMSWLQNLKHFLYEIFFNA